MALPVLFYLRLHTVNRAIRFGLLVAVCLTAVCVLGTQSRGAFVGLAVMAGVLTWRSPHRGIMLIGLVLLAVPAIAFMPEAWHARMATIENPGEDASFMGRVDAWRIAFDIALADPLTGGGFRVGYLQHIADRFTGGGYVARAHHSIYFEILAAMGFLGLAFFLLILALTWRNAAWLRRRTRGRPELRWAYDLASMMQAGLAGYVVAGATLSLEFWPGYWIIVPILMHARRLVEAQGKPVAAARWSAGLPAGAVPQALQSRRQ
jgi:probable O-glycosylation ligase (exosortase A-associated)